MKTKNKDQVELINVELDPSVVKAIRAALEEAGEWEKDKKTKPKSKTANKSKTKESKERTEKPKQITKKTKKISTKK